MVRTGDSVPVGGLVISPLVISPLAVVRPGPEWEQGPPSPEERALTTVTQRDEMILAVMRMTAGNPTEAGAWSALVNLVGGIPQLPVWIYWAIMAGIALLQIYQVAKGGNAIKGLLPDGKNGENGVIIPPDYGIRGPGIPEPTAGTFYKTWRIPWERRDGTNGYTWFWAMNDGYIIAYTKPPGKWARWKPIKPIAVLGRKMSLNTFLKADRYLDRFARRIAKRSSKLSLQRAPRKG